MFEKVLRMEAVIAAQLDEKERNIRDELSLFQQQQEDGWFSSNLFDTEVTYLRRQLKKFLSTRRELWTLQYQLAMEPDRQLKDDFLREAYGIISWPMTTSRIAQPVPPVAQPCATVANSATTTAHLVSDEDEGTRGTTPTPEDQPLHISSSSSEDLQDGEIVSPPLEAAAVPEQTCRNLEEPPLHLSSSDSIQKDPVDKPEPAALHRNSSSSREDLLIGHKVHQRRPGDIRSCGPFVARVATTAAALISESVGTASFVNCTGEKRDSSLAASACQPGDSGSPPQQQRQQP